MSQLLQQNDGPADTQRHHTLDSSTVSRNQTYHTPNTTPLTSDAGKRLVSPIIAAKPPLTQDPDRSQRKAAPSPLQTSTTATSPNPSTTPTRSTFSDRRIAEVYISPRNTTPQEEPRSPKERLNDLLASEKSYYTTGDSILGAIAEDNSSR